MEEGFWLGCLWKRNPVGCREQQKCCSWQLHNLAGDMGNKSFLDNAPKFPFIAWCEYWVLVKTYFIFICQRRRLKSPCLPLSHAVCLSFLYGFLLFPALWIPAWVYLCFQASHVCCIVSATLWPLSPSLMLSSSVLSLCAAPGQVKMCHFQHCKQWSFCLFAARSALRLRAPPGEPGFCYLTNHGAGFFQMIQILNRSGSKRNASLLNVLHLLTPYDKLYRQVSKNWEHKRSLNM